MRLQYAVLYIHVRTCLWYKIYPYSQKMLQHLGQASHLTHHKSLKYNLQNSHAASFFVLCGISFPWYFNMYRQYLRAATYVTFTVHTCISLPPNSGVRPKAGRTGLWIKFLQVHWDRRQRQQSPGKSDSQLTYMNICSTTNLRGCGNNQTTDKSM